MQRQPVTVMVKTKEVNFILPDKITIMIIIAGQKCTVNYFYRVCKLNSQNKIKLYVKEKPTLLSLIKKFII